VLRQFGRNRISYLVNDIVDTFQLTGTYKLEVNSSDDNHGRVAVNDIIIQSSGWVGTYFHNVPVSVTALPREGYEFSHWEGSLQGVEDSLILEASDDASLLAVFKVIDG
jgi:hypothetical protein